MNARTLFFIALVLFGFTNGFSQSNWYIQGSSEADINLEIKKAVNPLRILYVAAHPDDENTRLISWLVNDLHAEVAYLSITNGGGGQNLISEEIGEDLGLIREQELYAARRIDGGIQYFTDAEDFGFSKSYEETFEKWDKQNILAQVVYRIRSFKPDIIITRFSPATDGLRSTHGHHTASAILAVEAFTAAADPSRFKSQLDEVSIWETKAIYWNTSYWSYGSQEKLDSVVAANPGMYVKLNVEAYIPERGQTTSEIAAASRSMHKSQGFGTMPYYGVNYEYLMLIRGSSKASEQLNRSYVHLSSYANPFLEQALQSKDKSALILKGIEQGIKDGKLNDMKLKKLKELYLKSLGLRIYLTATDPILSTNEQEVTLSCIHFSQDTVSITKVQIEGIEYPNSINLPAGELHESHIRHPFTYAYTSPTALITINDIEIEVPVVYRTSDPVKGEIVQKVHLVKAAKVQLNNPEILIVNNQESAVKLTIEPLRNIEHLKVYYHNQEDAVFNKVVNYKANQTYVIELPLPQGNTVFISLDMDGVTEQHGTKVIKHEHIPWVYKSRPMELHIHRINVQCSAKNVAYVMGAGDKVPEAIEALGAVVTQIDYRTVKANELLKFDAVVFGIRALNVLEDIDAYMDIFYTYCEMGGTLIMQYNTSHRLKTNKIGSKEGHIKVGRGRVTEEDAPVHIHDNLSQSVASLVLQQPNKIEASDWHNWVQERGLYFATDWDPTLVSCPIGMEDKAEENSGASLLIGSYGSGTFVYTGISFFRELPAGVEGAYRLWANILSL